MGRGKIEIKKIENVSCRQVTFSKRRGGLFKKARELSVLCEAEVGTIVFSNTGRVYEFASSSMRGIIDRYIREKEKESSTSQLQVEMVQEQDELEILRNEVARLYSEITRLKGNDLEGMSNLELDQLEHQLNDSIISVLKKKEAMQLEGIERSNHKGQELGYENKTLRGEINNLESLNWSTQPPTQPGSSAGHSYHDRVSPDTVTDIETALQLWPTYSDHSKTKEASLTKREINLGSSQSDEMDQ